MKEVYLVIGEYDFDGLYKIEAYSSYDNALKGLQDIIEAYCTITKSNSFLRKSEDSFYNGDLEIYISCKKVI